jgi:integrase
VFLPLVKEHLVKHTGPAQEALLFPAAEGGHMHPRTFGKRFDSARDAAGRPDLTFHALRHTGAVLAAQSGATLADLMARLGHSTPNAAMRYQHAASDRDRAIAEALSEKVRHLPDRH